MHTLLYEHDALQQDLFVFCFTMNSKDISDLSIPVYPLFGVLHQALSLNASHAHVDLMAPHVCSMFLEVCSTLAFSIPTFSKLRLSCTYVKSKRPGRRSQVVQPGSACPRPPIRLAHDTCHKCVWTKHKTHKIFKAGYWVLSWILEANINIFTDE